MNRKPCKSPKLWPWVLAAVLYKNHPRVRNSDPRIWLRWNHPIVAMLHESDITVRNSKPGWNHPKLHCCKKTVQEPEFRTLGFCSMVLHKTFTTYAWKCQKFNSKVSLRLIHWKSCNSNDKEYVRKHEKVALQIQIHKIMLTHSNQCVYHVPAWNLLSCKFRHYFLLIQKFIFMEERKRTDLNIKA